MKARYTTGAWLGFALLLALAPSLWPGSQGTGLLAQMGIAIVACLSYNMLFGQGGMLSFGHAVYTGLGAYAAIHALQQASQGGWAVPVSLIPLVGGLAGMAFSALFGYVTTRKAGTPFAMITLGLGELVFASALMLPHWSGGEAGVSADRVVGPAVLGISYGPGLQVYYLIAVYTFICTGLMYAFTQTPLGRLLNAVRDNPERVEFIGYDTRTVRYLAFVLAGFFAGVSGGLAALWFEIVTTEVLGPVRSGAYLLFTFLGGAGFFIGPILGGVLMVLSFVWLAKITQAWLLYLGVVFLFMVMYAPGGLAGSLAALWRACRGADAALPGRRWSGAPLVPWVALLATAAVGLVGVAAMVEMLYHLQWQSALGDEVAFLGLTLRPNVASHWLGAAWVMLTGWGLFELARRQWLRDRAPGERS